MATLAQFKQKVISLDLLEMAAEALTLTQDRFLFLQKEQLYEGKDRTGRSPHPFYTEDPFFKTPESAQRYSDWKDAITPNPKREKGAPNFFITGFWYDSLKLVVTGLKIDFPNAIPQIEQKWGETILGLNDEKRAIYIETSLLPTFIGIIKKRLSA